MKSYRQELVFNIPGRMGFVNITQQVRKALQDSGIKEGLLLCNAMHITASVLSSRRTVCARTSSGYSTFPNLSMLAVPEM